MKTPNQRMRCAGLALLLVGMMTVHLSGHHGTAASYDSSKQVTITGKVTEFWWRNPHSALFIDATDEKGGRRQLVGRDEQPRRADASRLEPTDVRGRRRGIDRRQSVAGRHAGGRLPEPVHRHRQRQGAVGARTMTKGQTRGQTEGQTEGQTMMQSAFELAVAVGLAAMLWAPAAAAQAPDLSGVWLVDNSVGGRSAER